ncbi:MAG: DUF192 domain-containing protein [Planctomycetota bacterium]
MINRNRAHSLSGLLAILLAVACSGNGDRELVKPVMKPQGDIVQLEMGGKLVTLEVAATNATRAKGLMRRKALDENHGMIFIYKEPQIMAFYMRDTWIPLSIAFLKSDGTVINIEKMRPNTQSPSHQSRRYCRFAIEMNRGWFEQHGIKPGHKINLTPEILNIKAE